MFIHAKVENLEQGLYNIISVVAHPSKGHIDGYVRLNPSQIDAAANITIGSDVITYDRFIKYCRRFKTDTDGTIMYVTGVNSGNLEEGKLTTLDMSVPLSFTRANTIVNFGRL